MTTFDAQRRLLLVAAAGKELEALLAGLGYGSQKAPGDWKTLRFENLSFLQCGVGKASAAGAVARELGLAEAMGVPYAQCLNAGIGGALAAELKLGARVLASSSIMADEGTPLAVAPYWRSIEEVGFGRLVFPAPRTEFWEHLSTIVEMVAPVATISTISGNEELARNYRQRSGAAVEAMEGAAIALACAQFSVPFCELRVISNYCGDSDREKNPWDIPAALRSLKEFAAILPVELRCAGTGY